MPNRKSFSDQTQSTLAFRSGLPVLAPHAAGIDGGSRTHWAAAPGTQPHTIDVCEFPTHTPGLEQMADWLLARHVDTVAIEATGVYWIGACEVLEKRGLEVVLVDPKYTKQVKGRPQSDKHDCQWVRRLHSVGLLAGAFRPDAPTAVLPGYLRQKANLVRYAAGHIQHMHKALEQMNVKLTEVVSDITGKTGLSIIRAILDGQRDAATLARLRDPRCKQGEETIACALEGNWRSEQLFALGQALEGWEFYQRQQAAVDAQIEQQLKRMASAEPLPPLPPRPSPYRRKPNQGGRDLREALYRVCRVDLTAIEGIEQATALVLLSEIGTDMSKWASEKHFASWLGLAPVVRQSGGRVLSSRSRRGANRAALALRLAAVSLAGSASPLGAFFRRTKARRGAGKAVTATARKLGCLVYRLLEHGRAYVSEGLAAYEARLRQKQLANLKRKARQLGMELVERQPVPLPGDDSAASAD